MTLMIDFFQPDEEVLLFNNGICKANSKLLDLRLAIDPPQGEFCTL